MHSARSRAPLHTAQSTHSHGRPVKHGRGNKAKQQCHTPRRSPLQHAFVDDQRRGNNVVSGHPKIDQRTGRFPHAPRSCSHQLPEGKSAAMDIHNGVAGFRCMVMSRSTLTSISAESTPGGGGHSLRHRQLGQISWWTGVDSTAACLSGRA